MNTYCSPLQRLTVAGGLALAALAAVPHAQAFVLDAKPKVTPDWSIALDKSCSAVQISAHIALTTGTCVRKTSFVFYPGTGVTVEPYQGLIYNGPDRWNTLVGDVGMLLTGLNYPAFSQTLKPADILSYAQEKLVLAAGDNSLTNGGKLVLYSTTAGEDYIGRKTVYTEKQVADNAPSIPLMFRSLTQDFKTDSSRFNPYGANPILPRDLLNLYDSHNAAAAFDRNVLAIAGLSKAPYVNPVTPSDEGGSIFLLEPDSKLSLLGILTGTNAHIRLSHYWPWIYQTAMRHGLRIEAGALARKLLGTPAWGTTDAVPKVGEIYMHDNRLNYDFEFFRLISPVSDPRAVPLPQDRQSNSYWHYLGTTLPDLYEATTPIHLWGQETVSRVGNIGDIYVYNNPFINKVLYFRLRTAASYDMFPVHQGSNAHWQYLGTRLNSTMGVPPPELSW
jgi:hypothetical protein